MNRKTLTKRMVDLLMTLGLHWNLVTGRGRRAAEKRNTSGGRAAAPAVLSAVIAVYGLYVFLRRNLPSYMFLRTQFVFLDFGEPVLKFYLDYLAMMGLFLFLSHYGASALRRVSKKKKQ